MEMNGRSVKEHETERPAKHEGRVDTKVGTKENAMQINTLID